MRLSAPHLLPKPTRTTTKRLVYGNNIAAWIVLVAIAFLAPAAVGEVAWPIAFIIVGILGFYTGTGSFDLYSLAKIARARGAAQPTYETPPEEDTQIAG